ncbi:MAG: hypothetical protein P9X24_06585 [Candidatus Hatepunaea meridiana]|nr:hypothetical protein [Candidatus Hatepunaea meridiana]
MINIELQSLKLTMSTYKHTQFGLWAVIAVIIGIGVPLAISFSKEDIFSNYTYFIYAAIFLVLILFGSLTVAVTDRAVIAMFGLGLIRHKVLLSNITAMKKVRNKWTMGWGIKRIEGGLMYNISGLDAVEFKLDNGKVFRIGTDEPEKLIIAVEQAIASMGVQT